MSTPPNSAPEARSGLPLIAWIGFGVSALCLAWFFRDVSWSELAGAFAGASYVYIVPTLVLNLVTYPIRVYRWYYLLPRDPASTFRNRFSATVIGFMATSIFPLRAGELVRAATFTLKTGIPIGTSLASIVLERVFDLIVVLMGLGICLVWLPRPAGSGAVHFALAEKAGLLFSGLVVAIVAFVLMLKVRPGWVLAPTRWVLDRLPKSLSAKADGLIESIVSGLVIVQGPGELAWLLVLSIVHWSVAISGIWICARSFHLEISPLGALLIFVFSSLSVALPQAPGFLGVFQVAIEASLAVLGASSVNAKGFALVYWALCIVPITLTGFLALYGEGLSLAQVRSSSIPAP